MFLLACTKSSMEGFCRVWDRILQSCDLANHFLSPLPWENAACKCSKENHSLTSSQENRCLTATWNWLAPHRPRASSWDLGLRAAGKAWVVEAGEGSVLHVKKRPKMAQDPKWLPLKMPIQKKWLQNVWCFCFCWICFGPFVAKNVLKGIRAVLRSRNKSLEPGARYKSSSHNLQRHQQ